MEVDQDRREGEERFQLLAKMSPDAIVIHVEGRIVFVNDAGVRMLGAISPEEIIGKSVMDFIHPEYLEIIRERIQHILEKGKSVEFLEQRLIRLDGTSIDIEAASVPHTYGGKPAIQVVARDITERKRALQSILESEEKHRSLFETMAQGVVYQDSDGHIISANPAAERILGISIKQMMERTSEDRRWGSIREDGSEFPGSEHPSMMALRTGKEVNDIIMGVYNPKEDRYHWINIHAIPQFRHREDTPFQVFTTFDDITERKHAEDALFQSEEAHRLLFEQSVDGIIVISKGRIIKANQAFCEFHNLPAEKVIGMNPVDLIYPEDRKAAIQRIEAIRAGESVSRSHVYRSLRADGSVFWAEVMSKRVEWEGEPALQTIVRDITDRKQAEKALKESEGKYRTLIEQSLQGIMIAQGSELKIVFANPAALKILGHTLKELLSFDVDDIKKVVHPEDQAAVFKRLSDRFEGKPVPFSIAFRLIKKDGSVVYIDASDSIIEYEGRPAIQTTIMDITERKRAEEELKALKELNEAIIENSPIGIHFVDKNLIVKSWNSYFEKYTGISKQDIIGRNLFEAVPGIVESGRDRLYLEAIQEGYPVEKSEYRQIRTTGDKKGTVAYQSLRIQPVVQNGDMIGAVTLFEDITERKQAERSLRESESRYRLLFERNLAGVYYTTIDGRIVACNQSLADILGYNSIEEVLSCSAHDFYWREADRESFISELRGRKAIKGLEALLRRKDDKPIWVLENSSVIFDENGEPAYIHGTLIDITDRKQATEALQKSEQKYRELYENLRDGSAAVDMSGRIVECNSEFLNILKYEPDEICRLSYKDITPEKWHAMEEEIIEKQVMQRGYSDIFEKEYIRKDGTVFPVELRTYLLRDQDGNPSGMWAYVRNITRRKEAEVLQNAVYRISQAVDNTDNLNELYQAVHKIIQDVMPANNFYIALYNEDKDLVTFPYFVDEVDVPPPPHISKEGLTKYVLQNGTSLLCDAEVLEKLTQEGAARMMGEHSKIWLGVPLKIKDKTIGVMTVQHYTDPKAYSEREQHMLEFVSAQVAKAIEKKRSDAALRESEGKYRTIVDNTLEGIYITQNHIVKFCNQRFADMFGFNSPEEAIGQDVKEIVSPKSWEMVDAEVKARESGERSFSHYTFIARRVDGTEFDVETLGSSIIYQGKPAIQGVMRDISEQRKLEEQLRHAQKMEAVGRLAGGVAHDFNNLLTAITGHSDMALMSLDVNDPLRSDVVEIQNAAKRAADLTQQLLAFSRKQTLKPKIVDLNTVILAMDKMLRRIIGENIELTTIPAAKLWNAKVDLGQFEQVVVNLVINASDAMPKGGKLTIETKNIKLDKKFAQTHPDIEPGHYVMMSVSDTGIGIPDDVIVHIFEPFFTTKEAGKGTGLGLSTIYGIVKQSGGHILADSELGKGSTFTIYLPRATGKAEKTEKRLPIMEMPGGNETVLVVEDEQTVRSLAVKTLRRLGYKVLQADNGGDAFLMCERMEKPADLIVTDVIMPGMSGSEFVKRVQKIWHEVKVLYISGYAFDGIVNNGALDSDIAFLRKPFRLNELAQKVREVLDK